MKSVAFCKRRCQLQGLLLHDTNSNKMDSDKHADMMANYFAGAEERIWQTQFSFCMGTGCADALFNGVLNRAGYSSCRLNGQRLLIPRALAEFWTSHPNLQRDPTNLYSRCPMCTHDQCSQRHPEQVGIPQGCHAFDMIPRQKTTAAPR